MKLFRNLLVAAGVLIVLLLVVGVAGDQARVALGLGLVVILAVFAVITVWSVRATRRSRQG
jgi:uncharacterized membrane protein YqjE